MSRTGSGRVADPAAYGPPSPPADQAAYAAALSGLPGMGPATLVAILDRYGPAGAWDAVLSGEIVRPISRRRRAAPAEDASAESSCPRLPWPEPSTNRARSGPGGGTRAAWATVAARLDPARWWDPLQRAGIRVTWRGQPDYPSALAADPDPPGALFWRGDLGCLDRICVAIVGTRAATPEGRRVAFEMGRDLTEAGVCVVSGLALGIDGAAHTGAIRAIGSGARAGPVGIAASGVDVPYPRRHATLWERVVASGAVVSENLPGRPAQAWRFPSRNRVIAGVSRMVVVVESHSCGGSLITAEAAIERGIEVRAVPGPVQSAASAGTNQLLYDGPGPVRHAQDVLDALGVVRPPTGPAGKPPPVRTVVDPAQRRVLGELGWVPVTAGRVMERTGMDAASAERVLHELEVLGLARHEAGWWYRRR